LAREKLCLEQVQPEYWAQKTMLCLDSTCYHCTPEQIEKFPAAALDSRGLGLRRAESNPVVKANRRLYQ
jgi:hypothetical protein